MQQEFTYLNDSKKTLETLYFNDWANAYSDKNTALAKSFAEQFKRSLHLAKDDERGFTNILTVVDDDYRGITWERSSGKDIIKIFLNKPLLPNQTAKIFITYTVKLPPNKYTPYGYSNRNEYYLKDWYLTPAVFDGKWHLYSNKNLEDLHTGVTETTLNLIYPENLYMTSNYRVLGNSKFPSGQQAQLEGKRHKSCELIFTPLNTFTTHVTPHMTIRTDITATKYDAVLQALSIDRVTEFIYKNLGKYPHAQLLVSNIDYSKNPLYGLNQLPKFIRPYDERFQFEMKILKTALTNILEETLYLDPRKEQWLNDAIANYLMIAYVEEFYPDQKLLGKLSKIWGIRSFNLAKMGFNEQYPFVYLGLARKNLDQPLITPNDSLIVANQKVGNKYKAGLGLSYLASYIGKGKVDESIKTFYQYYQLNRVRVLDFESILKRSADQDIDWFFNNYVYSDRIIDYKIKKVKKTEDSLKITLKNKEGTVVPISMFGLSNDSIVSKYWFSNIEKERTVTIPRNNEERLVLNYDQKIPEFNQRDNWKSLGGFLSGNKKLKFTFLQDSENPYFNQIFYTPVLEFNIYDGWTPGMRLHNKTLLKRPFEIDVSPSYSFREKAFVGSGSLSYLKYLSKTGLYFANYRVSGGTRHFNVNSRYSTFTPSIRFGWRPENLISNKRQFLSFRYVNIFRDLDENLPDLRNDSENPDYSVFNVRYAKVDNNILNYSSLLLDFQQASKFTKISAEYEYRKLFDNNRQFNLRLYAGKFLRNKTNSDFFSFALDRPTDYLFDYGYLGRSEDSGLYSQQLIIAEGGFKSFLDERYRFSNDWILTANSSVNLWRWIELYGDIGLVKNRGLKQKLVYDSGVRLNLVTDYFELYLPLYSNNGWEISQPSYGEKIRFIVTVDIKTLTGLFTRKWF
ncbi:M1 family metallopeptidase [Maribacter algarum]|uniref:M1 family metallopeptidase n=1 Tax=Maribacter algarum (ex Zhang et al. 2020) TaxID=2578118 RepID=A0A5S3PSG8_9FLAO|nr:M1 family metallopeptidase [Maribacter algarum]